MAANPPSSLYIRLKPINGADPSVKSFMIPVEGIPNPLPSPLPAVAIVSTPVVFGRADLKVPDPVISRRHAQAAICFSKSGVTVQVKSLGVNCLWMRGGEERRKEEEAALLVAPTLQQTAAAANGEANSNEEWREIPLNTSADFCDGDQLRLYRSRHVYAISFSKALKEIDRAAVEAAHAAARKAAETDPVLSATFDPTQYPSKSLAKAAPTAAPVATPPVNKAAEASKPRADAVPAMVASPNVTSPFFSRKSNALARSIRKQLRDSVLIDVEDDDAAVTPGPGEPSKKADASTGVNVNSDVSGGSRTLMDRMYSVFQGMQLSQRADEKKLRLSLSGRPSSPDVGGTSQPKQSSQNWDDDDAFWAAVAAEDEDALSGVSRVAPAPGAVYLHSLADDVCAVCRESFQLEEDTKAAAKAALLRHRSGGHALDAACIDIEALDLDGPPDLGVLPCKHSFCFECIDSWSKVTTHCCVCKQGFASIEKKRWQWVWEVEPAATLAAGELGAWIKQDVVVRQTTIQRISGHEEEDRRLAQDLAQADNGYHVHSDEEEEEGEDERGDEGGGGINWLCQRCGHDDDPDKLLLCDGCDQAWHTYCLRPPLASVPEGHWLCEACNYMWGSNEQFKSMSKGQFVARRQQDISARRRAMAAQRSEEGRGEERGGHTWNTSSASTAVAAPRQQHASHGARSAPSSSFAVRGNGPAFRLGASVLEENNKERSSVVAAPPRTNTAPATSSSSSSRVLPWNTARAEPARRATASAASNAPSSHRSSAPARNASHSHGQHDRSSSRTSSHRYGRDEEDSDDAPLGMLIEGDQGVHSQTQHILERMRSGLKSSSMRGTREGQKAAAALDVVAKALKSNLAGEGFRSLSGRDAVHRLTTQGRARGPSPRGSSVDGGRGVDSDSDDCIMGGEHRRQVSGSKRSTSTKQSSSSSRQAPQSKRARGAGASKRAIIDDSDSSDALEIIEDTPAALETFRYPGPATSTSTTTTAARRATARVPDDEEDEADPIDLTSPSEPRLGRHRGGHSTMAAVPLGSSTVSRRCQPVTSASNGSRNHVLAARSEDSQVMGLWEDDADLALAHSAVL